MLQTIQRYKKKKKRGKSTVLGATDRFDTWQALMQQWSRPPKKDIPTGKSEFRTVVDAVDDDLTSQTKAYTRALVAPAKSAYRLFLERLAVNAKELAAIAEEYPVQDSFTRITLDESALQARITALKLDVVVAKFPDDMILDVLRSVAQRRADLDI